MTLEELKALERRVAERLQDKVFMERLHRLMEQERALLERLAKR